MGEVADLIDLVESDREPMGGTELHHQVLANLDIEQAAALLKKKA